ncbi:hypothetical protein HNQ64_000914 [Prosthecobacter dejongeii]|uniref:Uncharacterized protein n=1 Tax=Prosthecobacter dejongeii TaxID=48465 RepID=A0A7W8DP23_9BACT|nr:hypothetical protein [Prosthecobacter dejongeii]
MPAQLSPPDAGGIAAGSQGSVSPSERTPG